MSGSVKREKSPTAATNRGTGDYRPGLRGAGARTWDGAPAWPARRARQGVSGSAAPACAGDQHTALDRTFHHPDRDVDVDAEPVRSDALRLRLKALRRYESYLISFKTAAKLMRRRRSSAASDGGSWRRQGWPNSQYFRNDNERSVNHVHTAGEPERPRVLRSESHRRGHCQLEQSEGDFRRFASAIHQVACDV